jgi:hypothetical protein
MSPRVHEAPSGVAAEAAAKAKSVDPSKLITDYEVHMRIKMPTIEAMDFSTDLQAKLKAVLGHNLGVRPAYVEVTMSVGLNNIDTIPP